MMPPLGCLTWSVLIRQRGFNKIPRIRFVYCLHHVFDWHSGRQVYFATQGPQFFEQQGHPTLFFWCQDIATFLKPQKYIKLSFSAVNIHSVKIFQLQQLVFHFHDFHPASVTNLPFLTQKWTQMLSRWCVKSIMYSYNCVLPTNTTSSDCSISFGF